MGSLLTGNTLQTLRGYSHMLDGRRPDPRPAAPGFDRILAGQVSSDDAMVRDLVNRLNRAPLPPALIAAALWEPPVPPRKGAGLRRKLAAYRRVAAL